MHKHYLHLAAVGLSLISTSAFSQSASSSGYALGVNQTITVPNIANATVTVGPLAATSGTAPPNYNVSNSVASLNQTATLTTGVGGTSEQLQTGLLSSNSMGTATGASATATVDRLSVGIGTTTLATSFLASIFGIEATTIQSTSSASISGLTGSTTIADLMITGSGLGGFTFSAAGNSTPMPNTVLFMSALLGVSIILNEQIISGNSITTNAIHVAFNNFAVGTGLKSGDIIISQTQAAFTPGSPGAVPEPSTWAMMLLGFGAIGVSLRRRRKSTGTLRAA